MRTAELPVARVDNAGELGIELIVLLNEVVLHCLACLTTGGWV